MKVLITGMAGFIGHALARRLAESGHDIWGIDNLNDYYDVAIKQARLNDLAGLANIRFQRLDITDDTGMQQLFLARRFDCVIHLAAQAGVRYSLEQPQVYGQANLIGHLNVLEGCRRSGVGHLLYASSSSVYGLDARVPFSVQDSVDRPASLYAATKKSNELMTHAYAHLYDLPATGLRFFTVYGPWGRPDMALYKFTRNLHEGRPIALYNRGDMSRDFTYIDDITESVARLMSVVPERGARQDEAPFRLYNVGHGSPINLLDMVCLLERATGLTANCQHLPMQPGDMQHTWADVMPLFEATGFLPRVELAEGIQRFVDWYNNYHEDATPADFQPPSVRCG